jgi:hypothetical protein
MKILVLCACAALGAAPAWAAGVEITPLVGYRFGGSFAVPDETGEVEVEDSVAFGASLSVPIADDGEIEVLWSRQPSRLRGTGGFFVPGAQLFDLTLDTFQAGGAYLFGAPEDKLRPYIAVGLGVTLLAPEPDGLDTETRFSASFGAGLKVWLSPRIGLKLEGRGFFTIIESDETVFCGSSVAPCLVAVSGTDLSQGEARVGIIFRF